MNGPRVGSLCSGYEGLGMAVQAVLGGELAFVADNDPGAARILAHHYPDVPNLGDITTAAWAAAGPVDILTAGFPCTDVSAAGARAGLHAGTRSGIWAHCARAIGELRPSLVVIENVRGLLSARGAEPTSEHLAAEAARNSTVTLLQWLDAAVNIATIKGDVRRARECRARTVRVMGLRKRAVARCQWHERRLVRAIGTVLGDLADLGYDTQWCCVTAADAGAPHRRERVFICAWPAADTAGDGRHERRPEPARLVGGSNAPVSGDGTPANAERDRREGRQHPAWPHEGGASAHDRGCGPACGDRPPAKDAAGATGGERGQPAPGQAESGRSRADTRRPGGAPAADADHHAARTGREPGDTGRCGTEPAQCRGTPADTERGGRDRRSPLPLRSAPGRTVAAGDRGSADIDWGDYSPAVRRWETILGRPAPRPTEPGRTGERLSPAFVEFLMGLPEGWVTGVPGLSRNDQLRALGNGVVPAQGEAAIRSLLERAPEALGPLCEHMALREAA